jgi:cobalt-zinc-cadmium efflux system membrane fusion protein
MSTLLAGALRAAALITALIVGPTNALAHGGEDHSHDTPAAAVMTAQPRVVVQSEQYELVGILRGAWLDIYLDRFSTNEPVPGAKIAVTIGADEQTEAEPVPNGTYKIASAKFAGSGPLELIFDIKAKAGDDLLIGTLNLPAKAMAPAAGTTPPSTSWAARLHEVKDKAVAWVRASPALSQIPRRW